MSPQSETMQYDADAFDGGDGPDEPSGPPFRAIAMVLLAAVVLAIGIGLVQLFGGDDDSTPTAEDQATSQVEDDGAAGQQDDGEAQSPTDGQPGEGQSAEGRPLPPAPGAEEGQPEAEQPAPGAEGQPGQGTAQGGGPDVTNVPVQIFNNSNVSGLAGRTGEALRENGFAVGDVANLPSNQGVVPESTAYYGTGAGEQQAAQAIAAQLGIPAMPRPGDLAPEANGVIVIVTQDLDR